jgi:hypothetical protein
MSTRVIYDERLPRENVVFTHASDMPPPSLAERLFLDHQLLVIDGIDWGEPLRVIQERGLEGKSRAFKDPFISDRPAPEVQDAVDAILRAIKELYPLLYTWKPTIAHSSFRPMITGPEPMHYDSYGGEHPLVTAYMNVSTEPRTYCISYTFEQLLAAHPEETRAAYRERKRPDDDASYPIRMRTQRGKGPLGHDAPRHTVHLAPGAIWFFNAKTVSHEVVYGAGAIGIGWEVPDSGAELQRATLKRMGKATA